MYADDILIYLEGNNINEIETKLQLDINNIYEWTLKNKMILNPEKTKCMVISKSNTNLNLNLNQNKITNVNEMKYLGIIIDNKITFRNEINKKNTQYIK